MNLLFLATASWMLISASGVIATDEPNLRGGVTNSFKEQVAARAKNDAAELYSKCGGCCHGDSGDNGNNHRGGEGCLGLVEKTECEGSGCNWNREAGMCIPGHEDVLVQYSKCASWCKASIDYTCDGNGGNDDNGGDDGENSNKRRSRGEDNHDEHHCKDTGYGCTTCIKYGVTSTCCDGQHTHWNHNQPTCVGDDNEGNDENEGK